MRQLAFLSLVCVNCFAQTPWATTVKVPSNETNNSFYLTNQAPLKPQYLVKLPVGTIRPGGWLLKSLELEREGLAGNLGEISAWLTKRNNAWLSKDGKGEWGWEDCRIG